ncbi:MAG: abortive infection family protein [Gemmatimonadaceae bacterium]|nr:abortive infection family protein [Gemmatimonadaceae bacterium]
MADLDAVAPNYRRARQRWPDAPMLCSCHDSLCACFAGSAHGQVEQVKAFIDSVCLTIVTELRAPMPESTNPTTTQLLNAALTPLGLQNSKHATALGALLSGFNKVSDAIATMRNENGPVAHGKEGFLDAVATDHARAFVHAGDAIIGLILNSYEGKQPDLVATREPYESFPHLNERIDRAVALSARIDDDEARPVLVVTLTAGGAEEAFELRVQPSELLYGIDREAYVDVLKSADVGARSDGESGPVVEETIKLPQGDVLGEAGPTAALVPGYQGALAPLRAGVESFLAAAGLDPSRVAADGAHLLDSILATADASMGLDWKERPPLQARVKVASRRVLVRFGVPTDEAEKLAEQFVAWLRIQAPDGEVAVAQPDAQGAAS